MIQPPSRPEGYLADPGKLARAGALVSEAEELLRSGRVVELEALLGKSDEGNLDSSAKARLGILRGTALCRRGRAVDAIAILRQAVEDSRHDAPELQFSASLALFERGIAFLAPREALRELSSLRQLATSIGDAPSLGALHLAIARLEACRGFCIQARRHLEIARRFAEQGAPGPLLCSVDQVESGLELVVGNLIRARELAQSAVKRAEVAGLFGHAVASIVNLGTIATWIGSTSQARQYLDHATQISESNTPIWAGALDALAQLALYEDDTDSCQRILDECRASDDSATLPARSWNQLSHELTHCAWLEHRGDWSHVIATAERLDPELSRRQFRGLRTTLLCGKARALARLGCGAESDAALAIAVRCCPSGAVDPLIVVEASRGICLGLRGDTSATLHFDRALAACRAIGHRYYGRWIERQRSSIVPKPTTGGRRERRDFDLTHAALLLNDAATILGAGHSIDLLGHRTAALLEHAFPEGRVQIRSESGRDHRAELSASWEQDADGTVRIGLRGSDRAVTILVRDVRSLDEVSLAKSVADLVRAAVSRTDDVDGDDDEQSLWPRAILPGDDDTVFRSPRMTELLKIAMRLASTELPILIGGETGTGKEIFARLIHDHSRGKHGPFVAYNCSAMPRDLVESQLFGHRRGSFTGATDSFPGLIRAAEHGTLFLDEIGDLDPFIQPKLLRFLEGAEIHPIGELKAQRVPVRIVAATNANLDDLVASGRFRQDLFYRLGVARLQLPPLRERKDEIPALAALFLTRYARECRRTGVRLGDDLIAALLLYDWPGNIRQLANEIRRLVAMADDGATLKSGDLMPEITRAWNARPTTEPAGAPGPSMVIPLDQPLDQAIESLERRFIERAMDAAGGRVAEAAQLLGISRKGLFLKRRRWDRAQGT